jgi:hypothetical protein
VTERNTEQAIGIRPTPQGFEARGLLVYKDPIISYVTGQAILVDGGMVRVM